MIHKISPLNTNCKRIHFQSPNIPLITFLILPLLLAILTTLPSSLAVSPKFTGKTVFATVTTQAQVDALGSEVNAIGYDIAILVDGSNLVIDGKTIHDSTWYGIAVDMQQDVTVSNCEIYNIGDHTGSEFTPTGNQHGVAIYFWSSSGTASGNTVSDYQKGGIVTNNDPANPADNTVNILDNTVTGLGQVTFIAQNGIQMGYGMKGLVRGNAVSGNYYVDVDVPGKGKAIGQQDWVSCGILLYLVKPGANGVEASQNKISDNQVPYYIYPAK
ncbi:hypothetical protein A3K80_05530 [Candidatus Bathyarchaeota archaeon RBG_13_38_9]|nr:MAG: hypothetical protein A3K80_05530 [Candidatus Bathyarchaeota archaeon RBG_13_38_9]